MGRSEVVVLGILACVCRSIYPEFCTLVIIIVAAAAAPAEAGEICRQVRDVSWEVGSWEE